MKYHLIPVRIAIIKKPTNNKYWGGCGKNRTTLYCWWQCKQVQLLWRTVWRFLKKLRIQLCCCSVSKSCLTLLHLIDYSLLGSSIHGIYLLTQMIKNLPAMRDTLGLEDPLERGMATHFSILVWRIAWREELGGL